MASTPPTLGIIGAGIAGLTAAIVAGRRGARVRLFEKANAFGGRARTRILGGRPVDLGPHALYEDARRELQRIGVAASGAEPVLYGVARGKRFQRVDPTAGLFPGELLGPTASAEAARVLSEAAKAPLGALGSMSIGQWLVEATGDEVARTCLGALVRLTSYVDARDRLAADAALKQLRVAAAGVHYLHDGFGSLIDGLTERAECEGVQRSLGHRVRRVRAKDNCLVLETERGRETVDAVIVTTGPSEAAELLPGSSSLLRRANETVPIRAACLDLSFDGPPGSIRSGQYGYVFSLDVPCFGHIIGSDAGGRHGTPAGLSLARYIRPGEAAPVPVLRSTLERFADVILPNWRAWVRKASFLPELRVMHGFPEAAHGGLASRKGPEVEDVPGVYVAGDWVGTAGLLAVASVTSGREAAERAVERATASPALTTDR